MKSLLRYQQVILPIIMTYLPDAKVILYGSRARGDDGPGSDIDIALDMGMKIDQAQMVKIISDLEESDLPINFDLVDFNMVSQDMQQRILKDGVTWKE